jgi:hypothetical protein
MHDEPTLVNTRRFVNFLRGGVYVYFDADYAGNPLFEGDQFHLKVYDCSTQEVIGRIPIEIRPIDANLTINARDNLIRADNRTSPQDKLWHGNSEIIRIEIQQ